jgi:hypothetical protein
MQPFPLRFCARAVMSSVCACLCLRLAHAHDERKISVPPESPFAFHHRPSVLSAPGTAAPRGATVPAYGVNLDPVGGNAIVSFDAANPGELTFIAPTDRTLVGGAFVDNDFSKFYTLDFDTGDFLSIDTSDGSETLIGNSGGVGGGLNWTGLAADPTTGFLIATATELGGDDPGSFLYSIDVTTGFATLIAPFGPGRIIDVAIRADGHVFGVDILGDQVIDFSVGPLGPLDFDAEFAAGLDFDQSNGVLYFAAIDNESPSAQLDQMYTIDTTSGFATLIGGISEDPGSAQISALAIAISSGGCSSPQDVPWLSETPTAGTTAPGTSTPGTVTFDASALAPGTYSALLCVQNNDPDHRLLPVPVELTVE